VGQTKLNEHIKNIRLDLQRHSVISDHKYSVYSLFLINSYFDRYNAYLRFKCHANRMLLHRSLNVEISICYIFALL